MDFCFTDIRLFETDFFEETNFNVGFDNGFWFKLVKENLEYVELQKKQLIEQKINEIVKINKKNEQENKPLLIIPSVNDIKNSVLYCVYEEKTKYIKEYYVKILEKFIAPYMNLKSPETDSNEMIYSIIRHFHFIKNIPRLYIFKAIENLEIKQKK